MKIAGYFILLPILFSLSLNTRAEGNNNWQFELTPYLWVVGMEGSTGPKNLEADVDMNFGDILDNLDKAFIINMEANKGQWSIWLDFIKMKLSKEGAAGPFNVDLGMKQMLTEVAVAYQLPEHEHIDLFVGGRYADVDATLTFDGMGPVGIGRQAVFGDSWVDPLLGIRGTWNLSDKWNIRARGDIGGFGVGSDFSWHAILTAKYQLNETISFKIGYRYLDIDYDDNGFVYNMATSGITAGVGFRF